VACAVCLLQLPYLAMNTCTTVAPPTTVPRAGSYRPEASATRVIAEVTSQSLLQYNHIWTLFNTLLIQDRD
jgi:hypothetical protein